MCFFVSRLAIDRNTGAGYVSEKLFKYEPVIVFQLFSFFLKVDMCHNHIRLSWTDLWRQTYQDSFNQFGIRRRHSIDKFTFPLIIPLKYWYSLKTQICVWFLYDFQSTYACFCHNKLIYRMVKCVEPCKIVYSVHWYLSYQLLVECRLFSHECLKRRIG